MTETETLLDEAANTNPGDPQTQAEGADKPVETPTAPDSLLDAAKQEAPKDEAKPVVPETYELKDEDGNPLELGDEFVEVAKKLNLTQEAAQDVVAKLAPALQSKVMAKLQDSHLNTVKQWAEETRADKEFGGDNLPKNMGLAATALQKTKAGKELDGMLRKTGFGNNRVVLRFLAEVGSLLTPDTSLVKGTPAQADLPLTARLENMYRTES